MTEDEINQKAWEMAVQMIMVQNRTFEAYSKGQIRRVFELARLDNFEKYIDSLITKYNPQPSRGQKPQEIAGELQKMKVMNENFANNIKIIFKSLKPAERMRFSQYLMWNIKIIEQRMPEIEGIKLILDCEKVKKTTFIIDHLVSLSKTNYIQSPRKSEQRERYHDRRR